MLCNCKCKQVVRLRHNIHLKQIENMNGVADRDIQIHVLGSAPHTFNGAIQQSTVMAIHQVG